MKRTVFSILCLTLLIVWVMATTMAMTSLLFQNPESLPAAMKSLGISVVTFAGKFLDVDGEKGKDIELLYLFSISLATVLIFTYLVLRMARIKYFKTNKPACGSYTNLKS